MDFKIGIGYDIHRLVEGRPLFLGGIKIEHESGLEGHSDADVLLHAVCDAIFGALGEGDIGEKFPDTEDENKDVRSTEFLKHAKELANDKGYEIGNLDCVVIAEEPKLNKYKNDIRKSMSDILGVPASHVNVKGKTNETLGDIGQKKAISAHAVILLSKKP